MRLPTYVPLLLEDSIRLEAVSPRAAEAIRASGLPLRHSWFSGWSIPVGKKNIGDHPALVTGMLTLAELGVKFGEDPKHPCSPAEFMRQLKQQGLLEVAFETISWTGPGQWHLTRISPK